MVYSIGEEKDEKDRLKQLDAKGKMGRHLGFKKPFTSKGLSLAFQLLKKN